jgi:GNAT superfamily N-acetyltransferase
MLEPTNLIKASLSVGRHFLRPPKNRPDEGPYETTARTQPYVVPIRSLGANHRDRIRVHLLALGPRDRYLRFGYFAHDEQIERYVNGLNFDRDEIFGIYNRRLELIAMAHLAYAPAERCESCAEFGVSVLASARGRGFGARLFDRAAMHAANDRVSLMFIHALSENEAMLKIARNAGSRVEREGTESEAYLQLPPSTLDSRVSELVEESVAQTDYRIKVQAKQFWSFLADVQSVRQSAIDAQTRTPP